MSNLSDGWTEHEDGGLSFKSPAKVVHDPVNSPLHYRRDDVECIDAMKTTTSAEGFEEYCRLNAFKYIWRANNKQNKVQDIKKAIWYLRMSIGDDPRDR